MAFAVDGVSQGINHTSQDLLSYGHVHDGAGPLHDISLQMFKKKIIFIYIKRAILNFWFHFSSPEIVDIH